MRHSCIGKSVGVVSIGLHLLFTLLPCVIGVHMCSLQHWMDLQVLVLCKALRVWDPSPESLPRLVGH